MKMKFRPNPREYVSQCEYEEDLETWCNQVESALDNACERLSHVSTLTKDEWREELFKDDCR